MNISDQLDNSIINLLNDSNDDQLFETSSEADDMVADPDFEPNVSTENTDILRRSNRNTNNNVAYDLMACKSMALKVDVDPETLQEALKSNECDQWKQAMTMRDEINSLKENGTWTLTQLPNNRKAIKTKWVYKTKRDDNGKIVGYKARIVAKGCAQVSGIDYNETFAPVIRYSSIRYLVALAARLKMYIDQMDAVTAFRAI